MAAHKETLLIDGPAGALEALLEAPATPRAIGVVCHPHPLHQGTMLNKVAHTLSRAMADVDIAALRFNFRGVGNSTGHHDNGVGEVADALAAAAWLRARYPGLDLCFAGFSFGGRIALGAAAQSDCRALVTVAPAISASGYTPIVQPNVPWLIVQGGADELVDCDEVVAWVDTLAPGPELIVMDDVDHFFHANLTPMRRHVVDFLGRVFAVTA